jgi:hypothetical protein
MPIFHGTRFLSSRFGSGIGTGSAKTLLGRGSRSSAKGRKAVTVIKSVVTSAERVAEPRSSVCMGEFRIKACLNGLVTNAKSGMLVTPWTRLGSAMDQNTHLHSTS